MKLGYPRSDTQKMKPRNDQHHFHYLCIVDEIVPVTEFVNNIVKVKPCPTTGLVHVPRAPGSEFNSNVYVSAI